MKCPACGAKAASDAWICAECDHILDPSVLEATGETAQAPGDNRGHSPIREERTKLIAWPKPEQEDSVPDAVILGNVDVAEDEFAVVHGAGAQVGGKTSTFLFYAAGSTTRVVHPDAVPRLTHLDTTLPRTPYEDFILSCVDGKRSVRDIQRASGLAPQEVAVTLLTLLDKNAVEIVSPDGKPGASPRKKSSSGGKKKRQRIASKVSSPTPETAPSTVAPSDPDDEDEMQVTQALDFAADAIRRESGRLPDDIDDLPSVNDFEEVNAETADGTVDEPKLPTSVRARLRSEKPTQSARKPTPAPRSNSMSDVWSEASVSGADADALIEREVEVSDPSLELKRPFVVPKDLDEDDAEEATAEVQIPDDVSLRSRQKVEVREPAPMFPAQEDVDKTPPPRPKPKGPSSPRVLDPMFLTEMPPSTIAPNPIFFKQEDSSPVIAPVGPSQSSVLDDEASKEQRKKQLAEAVKRATLGARGKRDPNAISTLDARENVAEPKRAEPSKQAPAPAGPKSDPRSRPERPRAAEPIDGQRMIKAQKLFDQALKDRMDGNLVSARMNMKLALTFDPTNEQYQGAFDDLNKNPDAQPKGPGSGALEKARDLYNAATEAENGGDVDGAIELLEKAIGESRQAAFLNRLGVILAMKKHQFQRAQELIEQAIDLAQGNANYEKNLSKVLSMAASMEMSKDAQQAGKKGGILGFLGRKR